VSLVCYKIEHAWPLEVHYCFRFDRIRQASVKQVCSDELQIDAMQDIGNERSVFLVTLCKIIQANELISFGGKSTFYE